MVAFDEVRALARSLPRSEEAVVRGRVRFRIGRIVYLGFSADETTMGFAFPREERADLVRSEPQKFHLPAQADMRYNWVRVWLAAIDHQEMTELVVEAWRMVVSRKVSEAYFASGSAPVRPEPDPPHG
jgi:hypothetical protein